MTARGVSPRYPIRAVSKLTGLGIDTLRAWERRHKAVAPVRDDRGRLYTDADVARLRLLRDAVEHGHSIGQVAGLSDRELHRLAKSPARADELVVHPPRTAPDATALRAALRAFDAVGVDLELARLASVLRPLALLSQVLMPTLAQIGDDWQHGRGTMAQEHLLSAAARHFLGSLLRLHARPAATTGLLFATPSGDRHEIGTLGAAMLAASSGLAVTYLGPDLPAEEIVASAKTSDAQVLVLGITGTSARRTIAGELRSIALALPKRIEWWVGGPGAERYTPIVSPRGLVLNSYAALQRELVRLGGRAT